MVRLQVFLSLRLFCPSFFVYGRVYFLSFNTILIYLPKKKVLGILYYFYHLKDLLYVKSSIW